MSLLRSVLLLAFFGMAVHAYPMMSDSSVSEHGSGDNPSFGPWRPRFRDVMAVKVESEISPGSKPPQQTHLSTQQEPATQVHGLKMYQGMHLPPGRRVKVSPRVAEHSQSASK